MLSGTLCQVAVRITLNIVFALELLLRLLPGIVSGNFSLRSLLSLFFLSRSCAIFRYAFGWRLSVRQAGCVWFLFDTFLAVGSAIELSLEPWRADLEAPKMLPEALWFLGPFFLGGAGGGGGALF